jgi:zinc transporter
MDSLSSTARPEEMAGASAGSDPCQGLVCGYRVDASGAMSLVSSDKMDEALTAEDSLVWLHFDQADPSARKWIEGCSHLPSEAKALLLGSDAHMRIEAIGDGLGGVVGDLYHEFAERSDKLDVLRLYLDNRCLISTRHTPMTAIEKLTRSLGEGLRVDRPLTLVTQFLHHVTDTLGDLMLDLSDTLQTLEDAVLDSRTDGANEELTRIRRVAARLRRHMVPSSTRCWASFHACRSGSPRRTRPGSEMRSNAWALSGMIWISSRNGVGCFKIRLRPS